MLLFILIAETLRGYTGKYGWTQFGIGNDFEFTVAIWIIQLLHHSVPFQNLEQNLIQQKGRSRKTQKDPPIGMERQLFSYMFSSLW